MVEPRVLRLLPRPAPALQPGFSSESDVESWDLRASFTEYFCAVRRDCLDFPVPPPKRDLLPELSSSAAGFFPSPRGLFFTSLRKKTSRSDGRVKSVHQQKRRTAFYIDFVISFSSCESVELSDQTVIYLLIGCCIKVMDCSHNSHFNEGTKRVGSHKEQKAAPCQPPSYACTQRVTRNSLK